MGRVILSVKMVECWLYGYVKMEGENVWDVERVERGLIMKL